MLNGGGGTGTGHLGTVMSPTVIAGSGGKGNGSTPGGPNTPIGFPGRHPRGSKGGSTTMPGGGLGISSSATLTQ